MALSAATQHYLEVVDKLLPELEVLADETDRTSAFPTEAHRLLAENDLLRLTLPVEWGGKGLTVSEFFPVLQAVAKVHGTYRMMTHGQNGLWRMLADWGSEEQKQEWLPVIAGGGLFTFALTEPDNGTGRDITTKAERDGDGWVVNGRKHLITWAKEAELMHLIARTSDVKGEEATCFLVPKGTPGVTVVDLPPTMGCRGSSHDIVLFEDVHLPSDAVLGPVGKGLELGLRGFLDVSRLGIAVSALGLAKRSFELSSAFAQQRVTFGQPIANRQAVRLSLAEMGSDIFALQSAIDRAAERFDAGESIEMEAAMCKHLAIDMVGSVTDKALRMHGGIGYTGAHKIERHYRDARALWFEEGSREIQLMVIASQLLERGLPS